MTLDKNRNNGKSVSILRVLVLAIILSSQLFFQPLAFSQQVPQDIHYSWMKSISLPALAVSSGGGGVVSNLTITIAYPGRGELFFSSEPLTMIDSQASARIAFRVAADIAGIDYRSYDAFVSLKSPSLVIGGPSAGAVMTIGFLSLFTGLQVNESVAMTGMVYPDGTIGPVGGVKDKMEAAAAAGYKVFLVPAGESVVMVEKVERGRGHLIITREPLNLTEYGLKLGIRVIEVTSIQEAAKYFLVDWKEGAEPGRLPTYSDEAVRLFINWIMEMNRTRVELLSSINTSLSYLMVNQSNTNAEKAIEYLTKGRYYIAASYMFSATALAEAAYIKATIDDPVKLDEYIKNVNSTINSVLQLISNIQPSNVSSLEALVTARQRALDAQHLLAQAIEGIYTVYDPNTGKAKVVLDDTTIIALAFAKWRSIAAKNWLDYSRIPSPPITEDDLNRVANDFMGLAGTVVSYYNSLLQDLGISPGESPSVSYQEGVNKLSEGDPVSALSYFIQSLADSMVGLHRVFDYQPRKIAEILKDTLTQRLSRSSYISIIALGYLEYGVESLNNYDMTGEEESLYSSIRLFTLGSLQDALTKYLTPVQASQLTTSLQAKPTESAPKTVTVTITETPCPENPYVNSNGTAMTVTSTVTITITETDSEGVYMLIVFAAILLLLILYNVLRRKLLT